MTVRSFINFGQALKLTLGINIWRRGDAPVSFSYCLLKNGNDKIKLVKAEYELTEAQLVEATKNYIQRGIRFGINIIGSNTLIREVNANHNLEELVAENFPFLKMEEVYAQLIQSLDKNYLTVARLDLMDLFKSLANDYHLISVTIGPYILRSISHVVGRDSIRIPGYHVTFSQGHVALVSENLGNEIIEPCVLGDDIIPAECLLAFSSGLQLFSVEPKPESTTLEHVVAGNRAFTATKRLFFQAKLTLITTLIVVGLTSVLRMYFQEEIEQMSKERLLLEDKSRMLKLAGEKETNLAKAYEELGWQGNLEPVFYVDQLAETVPAELTLNKLEVGTLNESLSKQEKRPIFCKNEIAVQGESVDHAFVVKWIKRIEGFPWVFEVTEQRFEYNTRDARGIFEFKILIQ